MIEALVFQFAAAATPAPSTRDLDRILGAWTFEDRSQQGVRDYSEKGVRRCEKALDDAYIRCESVGTNQKGIKRTYVFYLNYNSVDRQYEMVALHGNWSRKSSFVLTIQPDSSWRLVGEPTVGTDGVVRRNWGSVRFDGDDRVIWETRLNASDSAPDSWPLYYVDRMTRMKAGDELEAN